MESIDQLGINTVRVLAADAVQKANSGHPGTPMGLAPVGHVLWSKIMRYNPANPKWPGRDRFVLSCGHACMLQYAYLFLTGYKVQLEDLKNFRQLHSIAAGHPEYGLMPGIEVTTGPLGQGFANGVGLGIGQQFLAARYNKPDFPVFDYHIYAICSDGDLMEGISAEAASIAGHLKLGNLIYVYDDNHITIEGSTDLTFTEDVGERFRSYGWHVQEVDDGNDIVRIAEAIERCKAETQRPSLIIVRTHIGYGSPNKVDTAEAHGSALGVEEVRKVKEFFGFDPNESFHIPEAVLEYYRAIGNEGTEKNSEWDKLFGRYKKAYPQEASEYLQLNKGDLPENWDDELPVFAKDEKGLATRKASGKVLEKIGQKLPTLIGGAADLSPSTDTMMKAFASFSSDDHSGRNFHFGIREHSMGAILNGLALTEGIIAFGGTFLIFSDYMRPPMRLAAIMKIRPIYVFTHDSIGLGEDGTTHQPVEQLIGLRSVPNLMVIRPADANETVEAWRVALEHKTGPVALILTRQNIPIIDQKHYAPASCLKRGAYVLSDTKGNPDIILMGSGSEVHLLLEAQSELKDLGIRARVVSFPSWELFEKQDTLYKEKILPVSCRKRLAVEAGSTIGWLKYVTESGAVLGIDTFGESAPGEEVFQEYGFSVGNVVAMAQDLFEMLP